MYVRDGRRCANGGSSGAEASALNVLTQTLGKLRVALQMYPGVPMRLCTVAAFAASVFSISVAAHADTLTTYQVENQAGSSSLGTLTLDETSGKINIRHV